MAHISKSTVRKDAYLSFIRKFEALFTQRRKTGAYKFKRSRDVMTLKKLSSGIEGIVYQGTFVDEHGPPACAVKVVDLVKIKDTKEIDLTFLNQHPEQVYQMLSKMTVFHTSTLVEIVAMTLTNRLVFQGICPHFALNYYWEYGDNKLTMFNEFADGGNFASWAKQTHNAAEWFNAWFQIMIGLLSIQQYFGMVHADFHTKNVLVRRVPPGGYWQYTLDGKEFYLPNLGFVMLLNDFGFAWIPGKLSVPWHYKETLQYLTKHGRKFYDVKHMHDSIVQYTLPPSFRDAMQRYFGKNTLRCLFTKQYVKYRNDAVQADDDYGAAYKRQYEDYFKAYPNVTTSFDTKYTLSERIQKMFGSMYSTPPEGERIDAYSLSESFDTDKVPDNMQKLVQR